MKKSMNYSLIAALILCIVIAGISYVKQYSADKKLKESEIRIAELSVQLDLLKTEKEKWDADKLRVAGSIRSIRTVLVNTLNDLEEVTNVIGSVESILPSDVPSPEITVSPLPTTESTSTPLAATSTKEVATPTPEAVKATSAPETTDTKATEAVFATPLSSNTPAASKASPSASPASTEKPTEAVATKSK